MDELRAFTHAVINARFYFYKPYFTNIYQEFKENMQ
ncbi:hypothetical protein CLV60_11643 [Dyadobacter jiangsuensis]|uniref:Uncharacterized protein n=1 Tax=Dyadobacter jiangsuensis TaxID=1591085 RepID=A0A2P8FP35_9BACT|nr:hypothetical protein CLV60_11643 [Dyadobacter jiangsuensis]